MANWFEELKDICMEDHIVSIYVMDRKKVVHEFKTLDAAKSLLDYEFDDGFGIAKGPSFIAWGLKDIYFPEQYDGSESITSVPRNPCDRVWSHTDYTLLER